MNRSGSRGSTLAELCIVMAVIAIISTMVVSFTVLTQTRTAMISADRDYVDDVASLEVAFDAFLGKYDSADYTLAVGTNSASLIINDSNSQNATELSLSNGRLTAEEASINVELSCVKSLQFTLHVCACDNCACKAPENCECSQQGTHIIKCEAIGDGNGDGKDELLFTLLRTVRAMKIDAGGSSE